MENTQKSLVWAAVILGVSAIAATAIAAQTAYGIKRLGNTISVTGSAETVITSDTVKWSGRISHTVDASGLKAGNDLLKERLGEVRGLLAKAGVTDEQVTVRPVSVYPVYSPTDPSNPYGSGTRITGYSLDQSFTVESSDVDGVTALAQSVADSMLQKGMVFSTDSLEYYYSGFADLKLDLLSKATTNARERAQRIAASTGAKLGPVASASQGVFQVTAVNSLDVSDYGTYDTSVIQKKVTAVARTEFRVR